MTDYKHLVAALLLISLPCFAAAASDQKAENEPAPAPVTDTPKQDTSIFDFLNAPQKDVSTGLEWLSKRLDTFFASESLYEESTGSYARLTASTILQEGGTQSYKGDLSLRVELPHTKKKLKLTIETDADKNIENRPGQQTQPTPNQTLSQTSYFAGIEKKLAEESAWDIHTSTGLRIRSPLDPFVRLYLTREVPFEKWKLRFTETLFHFHSSGTGHSTVLELDRPMTKTDLFRMNSSATWWDKTDHYDLSQSFTFYHEITERRALSFAIAIFGTNKPTSHADTYLLDIRYRQRLHQDWLYAEINPQVLYEKINNFTPEHSLTLSLEMIFGNTHF